MRAGGGQWEDAHPGFVFLGFLSSRAQERQAQVNRIAQEPCAQVLLEAPHRIESLAQALQVLGSRRLTVGRELTKQFEQVHTAEAATLPAWMAADPQRQRGEFVLVLHARAPQALAEDALSAEALRVLQLLMAELPLKQAVALAAELTGAPRNTLYEQALAWRQAQQAADDETTAG